MVAWFEIDGSCAEVVVRGEPSRRIEVRQGMARPNRWIVPVGPHGQSGPRRSLPDTGNLQLAVPQSTRGLMVGEGDGPAASRRELPIGTGSVIVID